MQKTLFTAALTALFIPGTQNADAQTTRTDWNDIDSVIIYKPVHASQLKTLYILPIDDSKADYFHDEKEKTMKNVAASRAAFGPTIQKTINKAYKELDVELVDAAPASVGSDEMVLTIVFTEYNLGSAALRGWVGGGNAGLTLNACFTGENDMKFMELTQRHKSGVMDPNKYEKIIDKLNQRFADDFVTLLKALEKE